VRPICLPNHELTRRQLLLTTLATSTGLTYSGVAKAAWPERPIRIVVTYAPGGAADNTARVLAPQLAERLKSSVVVENKPGASGTIGAGQVARATADGYSLLFDASSFVVNPSLLGSLPYDSLKDFEPLSQIMQVPNLLVVPANSPFQTIDDLISGVRKAPGKYNYASSGNGSAQHLAAELFKQGFKLFITHIPYRGGGPAIADLVAGQCDMMFSPIPTSLPLVRSGKLRALALTDKARSAVLPQLPTVAESGLPGFMVVEWNGIWAPSGTPKAITERLETEVRAVVAQPDVQKRLRDAGVTPVGSSSKDFNLFIRSEMDKWAKVIKSSGIKPD
jgi:tripartite-type tricarboxylate transporter receptor subunit TctC